MTLDIAVAVYNYSINVYLKLFHYFGISYITCSIRVKSYAQGEGRGSERKYGRCDFHLADNFVIFDVNKTFS
jgi:hypothetical protein